VRPTASDAVIWQFFFRDFAFGQTLNEAASFEARSVWTEPPLHQRRCHRAMVSS